MVKIDHADIFNMFKMFYMLYNYYFTTKKNTFFIFFLKLSNLNKRARERERKCKKKYASVI